MSFIPKGWGEYPAEYNREIHGPYNPGTYYGKRDTPFGDVKLGELPAWISRRNKSPRAVSQAISRAWFRYYMTWIGVKKPGPYFFYQMYGALAVFGCWLDYYRIKQERNYRYH